MWQRCTPRAPAGLSVAALAARFGLAPSVVRDAEYAMRTVCACPTWDGPCDADATDKMFGAVFWAAELARTPVDELDAFVAGVDIFSAYRVKAAIERAFA